MKIGLYVPHDPHVFQPIEWKHLVLNAARLGVHDMRKELEKHGRDMKMKVEPTHTRSYMDPRAWKPSPSPTGSDIYISMPVGQKNAARSVL